MEHPRYITSIIVITSPNGGGIRCCYRINCEFRWTARLGYALILLF